IAVPANTDALGVNRIFLRDGIDAGHDVAKITAAKVLNVSLRKSLSLSVTAARVWTKHEVAHRRCPCGNAFVPARSARPRRSTVHADHERIGLAGRVILGKHEPALHARTTVHPVNIAHRSP